MPIHRVAVLVAVHNGEPHLRDAISSVLTQTYGDLTLIVVDDASTDGSAATLSSFRDERLRVVRNPANLGLTRSLNVGLELIESEYVARLDADDLAFPRRIAKQVAFLDAHPDVVAVGAQGVPIDVRGRHIRRAEWWHREWHRPAGGAALDWYRIFDTPFIHSSVMFRRELGPYDETFPLIQDADLWRRAARRGRLANLDERLVAMRLTASSMTGNPERLERRGTREQKVETLQRVMEDVLQSDDVPRRIAQTWVSVTTPESEVSAGEVRQLRDDIETLAARFPRERAVRLHRASLIARMMEKVAPVSRALALGLLCDQVRLDPAGALLFLPRFLALFVFGERPFLWLRALRRRAA